MSMPNQSRRMSKRSGHWLVGPRVHGGVKRPTLVPLATSVTAKRVLTLEDVFLHRRFLVVCSLGRLPTPKSSCCGPILMYSRILQWTPPWHVCDCVKVLVGSRPTSPTLSSKCAGSQKQSRCQVQGLCWWQHICRTKSFINFVDLTAKTHSNPLRDLQYLW